MNVFPHNCNFTFFVRELFPAHHLPPCIKLRFTLRKAKFFAHSAAQPFFLQHERHGIQRRRVEVLNHAIRIHIAKACNLPAQIGSNGHFAAADENIRLDADGKQLLHAVLRWFGFEFSRRVQIWNQRYMDKRAVFRAHTPANLADGLKERLTLDVAHRAADLHNQHIRIRARSRTHHARLNFIRDVRDDLHRAAVIAACALTFDDRLVNLAGSCVVVPGKLFIDEPLVMADVQIGLRSVIRHIHFAMLVRVHCTGVHIQIRIQFADGDAISPALEQAAKRRRSDALAKG